MCMSNGDVRGKPPHIRGHSRIRTETQFLCGGEWGGKGNDGKGHRLSDQEQQMSDEANQWNGTSSVIWHC